MKILKYTGLSIFGMAALFLVTGLALPALTRVERSIVISADADVIFDQVNDLVKNEAWSSWKAYDPAMKIIYGPVTAGSGASCVWKSQKFAGGKLTVQESIPFSSIKRVLDFGGRGSARDVWTLAPHEGGVKVTEGLDGEAGTLGERFRMMTVKGKTGGHMDNGLLKLKEISEGMGK